MNTGFSGWSPTEWVACVESSKNHLASDRARLVSTPVYGGFTISVVRTSYTTDRLAVVKYGQFDRDPWWILHVVTGYALVRGVRRYHDACRLARMLDLTCSVLDPVPFGLRGQDGEPVDVDLRELSDAVQRAVRVVVG